MHRNATNFQEKTEKCVGQKGPGEAPGSGGQGSGRTTGKLVGFFNGAGGRSAEILPDLLRAECADAV
jgi:hypothetical protein